MPTSDELMRLARACANRITPPRKSRQFPSFSEVEEQCEEEYEELLGVLHDDEVYRSADLAVQEQLVESIRAALPEIRHVLLEDLVYLQNGIGQVRNVDARKQLEPIAAQVSFEWIREAVKKVDYILEMMRRNIQKGIALDALVVELRER